MIVKANDRTLWEGQSPNFVPHLPEKCYQNKHSSPTPQRHLHSTRDTRATQWLLATRYLLKKKV